MIEIDNKFGTADVYCDICDTSQHFDDVDIDGRLHWPLLMDKLNDSDWKYEKIDGEWEHTCWSCDKVAERIK